MKEVNINAIWHQFTNSARANHGIRPTYVMIHEINKNNLIEESNNGISKQIVTADDKIHQIFGMIIIWTCSIPEDAIICTHTNVNNPKAEKEPPKATREELIDFMDWSEKKISGNSVSRKLIERHVDIYLKSINYEVEKGPSEKILDREAKM